MHSCSRLSNESAQHSVLLSGPHHNIKLTPLRTVTSLRPLRLAFKTRMYGYGSYYSTNNFSDYNGYAPEGYYEAASGPSSSQYSEPYGEHYDYAGYADDSQYTTQSYHYNGSYHEAGALPRYQRFPNQHGHRPYEQRYTHSSMGDRSPPRAPKAMREQGRGHAGKGREDDRDREVTPPPAPSPSPEYLALASDAPSTLADPSNSRKLLVLDLNGTLVFRSPHTSRPKYRPQDRGVPRLRPTFPRPYMRAFREYVFAPETKAWLDVMVWSSAQPHSVADMVDKCFGEHKRELVAVWARDTLGLSNDHYREHPFCTLVHHRFPRPGTESRKPLFALVPC